MRGVLEPCQTSEFWQGSQYDSGYVSLFETKNIVVLNSVVKNWENRIKLGKGLQLDQPQDSFLY